METEEFYLMTLKNDAKFEEKLTLGSKYDMRNLVNFNASSGKPENLLFDVLQIVIYHPILSNNCSNVFPPVLNSWSCSRRGATF